MYLSFTKHEPRSGATAVETAVVLPIVFVITIGIVTGGVTVYRSTQITCMAREAARWAAVRGGDYQKETGSDSPTAQQIYQQAAAPLASGINPGDVTFIVEWIDRGSGTTQAWDSASKDVRSVTSTGQYTSNNVRVTVLFSNTLLVTGASGIQSICEIPMSY